ncbi:hypothetical protein [Halobacterium noricense]|uniref:hypothetical protein n=1 Tax=Halobacterium noricense TaxID=223182 RepID=UPI001E4BA91B|nr:hypothetical protein [Halobacterium noricense]UHH25601.1 hypothetical protein LT974_01355 [Halobacterium noricense]
MADKYLEKGVSATSGIFTGTYGFDLVLPNTELIGSLGSAPAAVLGVILVLVAAVTVYKSLIDSFVN